MDLLWAILDALKRSLTFLFPFTTYCTAFNNNFRSWLIIWRAQLPVIIITWKLREVIWHYVSGLLWRRLAILSLTNHHQLKTFDSFSWPKKGPLKEGMAGTGANVGLMGGGFKPLQASKIKMDTSQGWAIGLLDYVTVLAFSDIRLITFPYESTKR